MIAQAISLLIGFAVGFGTAMVVANRTRKR